jgi:hypothetical protein
MKLRNVIDKELVKEPTNKRQPTTIEQSKQINLSDNLKLFIACNNRQGDTSKPWLPQDVIREIVKFTLLSEDIAIFLNLVVEGEQDQAEAMLRQTPELALFPGIVTDLSGRIFDNITGFQYAAWALDSHMWRMIRKYLPNAAAREQVKGLKTGLWVAQHGESASWQNLIDALDGVIKLCNQNEYNAADVKWRRDVGDAQLLLPVHVVNQYCHPKRSFYPCLDFNDQSPLPRRRVVYLHIQWWQTWKKLFCVRSGWSAGLRLVAEAAAVRCRDDRARPRGISNIYDIPKVVIK